MKEIINGIVRFQQEKFPQQEPLFKQLATGQKPGVLLVTCSDSRIDPCLLTQTDPGELFVLRNAGNIVPPSGSGSGGEEATIEYAVQVLKVDHVVVCGHSACGAVTGLLNPDSLESLPAVSKWLQYAQETHEILEQVYGGQFGSEEEKLNAAIRANVIAQLNNLRTHRCIAEAEQEGRIQLHGWVYAFERGEVCALQDARNYIAINAQTASEIPV